MKNRRRLGLWLLIIGLAVLLIPLFHAGQARYYQWQMQRAALSPSQLASEPVTSRQESPALVEDPAVIGPGLDKAAPAYDDTAPLFISIPALSLEAAVVRGTGTEQLRKGPGLYEQSPLPDTDGANVAIAGHRTTYGAWFRDVDRLRVGDIILLTVGADTYEYQVEEVFPVAKNDWSVVEAAGYQALTLTTCHPPGSARERLVVRARLKERWKESIKEPVRRR